MKSEAFNAMLGCLDSNDMITRLHLAFLASGRTRFQHAQPILAGLFLASLNNADHRGSTNYNRLRQ